MTARRGRTYATVIYKGNIKSKNGRICTMKYLQRKNAFISINFLMYIIKKTYITWF